ncbi:MAG: phosphate ABC transporter substrate-binding protein PstS [Gemmatimonadaceae bacterium]
MNTRFVSALSIVTILGCAGSEKAGSDSAAAATSSSSVDLTGAGATFPQPIYGKWFSDYATKTGVKINYQSVGSGAGIKQVSESTVDFGATDSPMTDEELAAARGGPILHFPTVLGAVVITYNLPEVTATLNLTGELIADIFRGAVTKWNDRRIGAENPGVTLPASDILVVHRSDGSGTSFVFTDYLTTVSKAWAAGPGRGKAVAWPVGLGGRGNEGVSGSVKQTPGTIGYVELTYAKQNRLPVARVKNAAGAFVEPTIASITAAAAGVMSRLGKDSDYRISIVNVEGADAYPISSFTWLLVYVNQTDPAKGKKLVDFMRWMYSEGQQNAAPLDYAPLPPALATQLTERLATIQGIGQ